MAQYKNLSEPARQAGQGLREIKDALFDEKIMPWFTGVFGVVLVTVVVWLYCCMGRAPQPGEAIGYSLLALALCGMFIFRFFGWRRVYRCYNRGEKGERLVDDALDDLRAKGYWVVSDVQVKEPGHTTWNIDHVAIGPNGVFCIETKYWTKADDGHANAITFVNGKLCKNGVPIPWNYKHPIQEVRRHAGWLYDHLRRQFPALNRETFSIQQVLAFPDWWVTVTDPGLGVYVVNLGGLVSYIPNRRAPETLTAAEIQQIRRHLSALR